MAAITTNTWNGTVFDGSIMGLPSPFGIDVGWFAMMFGAVNFWGMVNGKLTNYRVTNAYKRSRLRATANPVAALTGAIKG